MRICVFGASGGTGTELVRQGLRRGYDVTAFVRSGGAHGSRNAKLHVVRGDAMVYQDVETAIDDADAVLSALGHGLRTPLGMHEAAIDNIIRVMEIRDISRLISLTGSGVRHHDDNPPVRDVIMNRMLELAAGKIIHDGRAHARRIRQSGLDWTIVRAGRLTNAAGRGTYHMSETIRKTSPLRIPRADVARCMLDQLTDDTYTGKMPYVSSKPPRA